MNSCPWRVKLRLALWSLAAIVVIGVAAVLVAPLFISAEDVRNRLFAEIERRDRLSSNRQRACAYLGLPHR